MCKALFRSVVAVLFLSALAHAQVANDACASAIDLPQNGLYLTGQITGTTVSATNDAAASCDTGGAASRDVWYRFTNSSGTARYVNAATSGANLTIALSAFSACGGMELTCSDNCGTNPWACLADVPVQPGQSILIRVSDRAQFAAPFTLQYSGYPLIAGSNCGNPQILPGPGTYSIQSYDSTTDQAGQQEHLCVDSITSTSIKHDMWYQFVPSVTGPVRVRTCGLINTGLSGKGKIAVYAGAGCPTPGSAIACGIVDTSCYPWGFNPSAQFSGDAGSTYTIQIGDASPSGLGYVEGTFTVTENAGPPVVSSCEGHLPGTCTGCSNSGSSGRGCANSAFPNGAILTAAGIPSLTSSLDTLVLTADSVVGIGAFFQSNSQLASPLAFGDGQLCVSGSLTRLNVSGFYVGAHVLRCPTDGSTAQVHDLGGPLNVGDMRFYQCWYRDAEPGFCTTGTFNLTQALGVTWVQ